MDIDWTKVKDINSIKDMVDEGELFDTTDNEAEFLDTYIQPGLTDAQIEDAMFWSNYARGLILVTGPPGSGKGLFANMVAWKMHRYFNKTVILDYKPRPLMGDYVPFSKDMLVNQLDRMKELASVQSNEVEELKEGEDFVKPVDYSVLGNLNKGEWWSKQGRIFLKNAVMNLDEFVRYMPKRNTGSAIGNTIGDLFTIWRHLDILIIGMATKRNDIDQQRCFPELTAEVRCSWAKTMKHLAICTIYPLKFVAATGVVTVTGRPIPLHVNGAKERDELGGNRWYDLYNSKNVIGLEPRKSLRRKDQ